MIQSNTPRQLDFFDAVGQGHTDKVRSLVRNDPDLLQAFDYRFFGATPITRIAFHDNREMLTTLIELGADVNRRSDWSMGPWSPLHCAIFERNMGLAKFLLDHGAVLDVHTAAGMGRAKDVARMLDESPEQVHELGGDGCQPLHFADSPAVASLLLDRGADIEARCVDHFSTPVQYLADKRPEVARFLFSVGARPDIFSAVLADDRALVEKLIVADSGVLDARINQAYFPPGPVHNVHNIMTFSIGTGAAPIHAAAKANLPSMVELLVNLGQSPNLRGGYDDGMPLHIAAWNDHPEVARALIEQGAEIDARSGKIHNNSPAGWAIVAGSVEVFSLLMDRGAAILDWFFDDAQAAIDGEFRAVKVVPPENYERIMRRLKATS